MIIDAHSHIAVGLYDETTRRLLENSERYGISKFHVSGMKGHYPDETDIAACNADVYRFMKEQPGLVEGYCYINPVHSNASDVLQRGIEQYGMVGMKLLVSTFCDDPRVFPLIEQCIAYNIPILMHTWQKTVGQLPYESTGVHVARLAEQYPQSKLLMAHFGGNCYHGVKAVRDFPNVSLDFCGSMFRRDELDYAVEQIGAERILFGTDLPYITFLVNYGQVEEANLTPEQRELIYYKNALKLFDHGSVGGVK
jgi:predicted TIM-barrel fold metal-dependent hydrolase